jgi:hypothetical protein
MVSFVAQPPQQTLDARNEAKLEKNVGAKKMNPLFDNPLSPFSFLSFFFFSFFFSFF